jgi:hypothetical protein
MKRLAMHISSRDDQKLVVQTENFHAGLNFNGSNPIIKGVFGLLCLALLVLSEPGHGPADEASYALIAYEQIELNPILKMVAIASIVIAGLIFLAVWLKPSPPHREIKDNFFFDKSLDTVYISSNAEENIYGKISDIKSVANNFLVKDTSDGEGISLSTEGEYSVIVKFGSGQTLQMEYNSCSFFEADESQVLFRNLMFDSSQVVEQLRDFLNLNIDIESA